MGFLYQFIGTAIICTISMTAGLTGSWPASIITLFGSKNTTLSRPMTNTELSLLGSLSFLGSLISTLTAGYMLDKIGRKKCTIIAGLNMIVFWTLLSIFKQVEIILACVCICGMVNSIYLIASAYITEICEESIRGSMTACMQVCANIGVVLIFSLGGSLSYDALLYVGGFMSVASTACVLLLKDSPVHLLQIGKEKEAREALAFYRQLKVDDKRNIEQINTLKRILNLDLVDSAPEDEKLNSNSETIKKFNFWNFMRKSKSTRRALLINIVTTIISIFQGQIIVQMYVQPIVVEVVPTTSPVTFSVIMATVGVIAGSIAAYLTDIAGRRPLIIYGSICTGVSCLVLGLQLYFHFAPTYITLIFLYIFSITFTFGAGTVPTVLMAELYLPEVKSIITMIVLETNWISSSVYFFCINPILMSIGWGPVFFIFAVFCFLTAIFCFFFLPETKGLTVEEIQTLFCIKERRDHC